MQPLAPVQAIRHARSMMLFECVGGLPNAFAEVDSFATYGSQGINSDLFNYVVDTGVPDKRLDYEVSKIVKRFDDMKLTFAWFADMSAPNFSALQSRLLMENFDVDSDEPLGMTAELSKIPNVPAIPGLTVSIATTKEDYTTFFRTLLRAFEVPSANENAAVNLLSAFTTTAMDPHRSFTFFIGTYNGVPAATCMSFSTSHRILGIYNLSVLPEYRNKGIGGMMALEALKEGKKAFCKVAVLEASAKAINIFKKLGFAPATSYKLFIRRPQAKKASTLESSSKSHKKSSSRVSLAESSEESMSMAQSTTTSNSSAAKSNLSVSNGGKRTTTKSQLMPAAISPRPVDTPGRPLTPSSSNLNASEVQLYAWTSNSAFEKYLFKERDLHLIFRAHLQAKKPDAVNLLDLFLELHKYVKVNFTKRKEVAVARAQKIWKVFLDPDNAVAKVKHVSKETRAKVHSLMEKNKYEPNLFAAVALDAQHSMIADFSDWQVELLKNPEIAKLKTPLGKRALWVQEQAFEYLAFDDTECFTEFKSSFSPDAIGEAEVITALNFFKEVHEFLSLNFLAETDINRSTAKRIFAQYLDNSIAKKLEDEDIIFEFSNLETRAKIKAAIDDSSKPVNQKLFKHILREIEAPLREEFEVFQKRYVKTLKKLQAKEEKEKGKKK